MEKLIEILTDLHSDVDFATEENLIDDGTYDIMGGAKYAHTLEEIIASDTEARRVAQEYIK